MQETPVKDIVRALLTLPSERQMEAYDFILFLQSRYGQVEDVSDEWTDQDIHDLTAASLRYATATLWAEEESHDLAR